MSCRNRSGHTDRKRSRHGAFSPTLRPSKFLPCPRRGGPRLPNDFERNPPNPSSEGSDTQHVRRPRRTHPCSRTLRMSQNLHHRTPPHTPEESTPIAHLLQQSMGRGFELHDVARYTTVKVCDLRELWKYHNGVERPSHGILARSRK